MPNFNFQDQPRLTDVKLGDTIDHDAANGNGALYFPDKYKFQFLDDESVVKLNGMRVFEAGDRRSGALHVVLETAQPLAQQLIDSIEKLIADLSAGAGKSQMFVGKEFNYLPYERNGDHVVFKFGLRENVFRFLLAKDADGKSKIVRSDQIGDPAELQPSKALSTNDLLGYATDTVPYDARFSVTILPWMKDDKVGLKLNAVNGQLFRPAAAAAGSKRIVSRTDAEIIAAWQPGSAVKFRGKTVLWPCMGPGNPDFIDALEKLEVTLPARDPENPTKFIPMQTNVLVCFSEGRVNLWGEYGATTADPTLQDAKSMDINLARDTAPQAAAMLKELEERVMAQVYAKREALISGDGKFFDREVAERLKKAYFSENDEDDNPLGTLTPLVKARTYVDKEEQEQTGYSVKIKLFEYSPLDITMADGTVRHKNDDCKLADLRVTCRRILGQVEAYVLSDDFRSKKGAMKMCGLKIRPLSVDLIESSMTTAGDSGESTGLILASGQVVECDDSFELPQPAKKQRTEGGSAFAQEGNFNAFFDTM